MQREAAARLDVYLGTPARRSRTGTVKTFKQKAAKVTNPRGQRSASHPSTSRGDIAKAKGDEGNSVSIGGVGRSRIGGTLSQTLTVSRVEEEIPTDEQKPRKPVVCRSNASARA